MTPRKAVPIKPRGSARGKFSWADARSVGVHILCAAGGVVLVAIDAFASAAQHALPSIAAAAVTAGGSALLKFLQRLLSDTR